MATLLELYNLYTERGGDIQARFEAAILKAAWNVLNEPPETPNHEKRAEWADRVLSDPEQSKKNAVRFTRYALGWNTVLQDQGEKISDSDIEFIVAAQIDKFLIIG
jgi:hypothetical protein